jgi:excisionase family DNA binding protein
MSTERYRMEATVPDSRFLTLADVAEILNVSPHQARVLVRTGELAGIQVGGRGQWRVERTKLEEYIAEAYQRTAASIASGSLDDVELPR